MALPPPALIKLEINQSDHRNGSFSEAAKLWSEELQPSPLPPQGGWPLGLITVPWRAALRPPPPRWSFSSASCCTALPPWTASSSTPSDGSARSSASAIASTRARTQARPAPRRRRRRHSLLAARGGDRGRRRARSLTSGPTSCSSSSTMPATATLAPTTERASRRTRHLSVRSGPTHQPTHQPIPPTNPSHPPTHPTHLSTAQTPRRPVALLPPPPPHSIDPRRTDSLARSGVNLQSFYVAASICTPSRAALLTGRHGQRTGVTGHVSPKSRHGLPKNEVTMAAMLKAQGYSTIMLGKWHLGHSPGHLPTDHGFQVRIRRGLEAT